MTLIQSLILAFIQGVTEFLPVSSSGHLNLVQHFFGLTPSLSFDIFLNTATFLSVVIFFLTKIEFFKKNLLNIIVGTIPATIVGIFFKDQIEVIFANIKLLPLFFLFTSAFVYSTKFFKPKTDTISIKQAFIIGLIQAFAILPGVSRAGSTIFAGLLLGLNPVTAFNFSFSLFIPASLGAIVLDYQNLSFNPQNIPAFILAFLVGLVALSILKKSLVNQKFWLFSIYTAILAIFLFFFL